jgi:WD40 repeat protein
VPGTRALAWVGGAVVVGGDDGVLRRIDPSTGADLAPWPADGQRVTSLVPVPDGVIALRGDGSAARVVDGRVVSTWDAVHLATSAGVHVALARDDGAVVLAADPTEVVSSGAEVLGLALAADGATLAVARADQTVRVYLRGDRGWEEAARNVSADLRGVAWLAISPAGDALAVAGAGPNAEIWDLTVLREPPARLLAEVATRYGAHPEVTP